MRGLILLAALVAAVAAGLLVWSPWSTAAESFRFFAPTSFWNAPLPNNAPLDPASPATGGRFPD